MSESEYRIVSLRGLIDIFGEDQIRNKLRTFHCSRDVDRETYLWDVAIVMEKKSASRTYLAINPDDKRIIGYFTIGVKCLQVPDDAPVSNSMKKKMNVDGTSKIAQSYLIGQLGRDDESPKGYGEKLLTEALRRLRGANMIVGCRIVRVDCSDELIPYYAYHGFQLIRKNKDLDLNQMVISI